MPHAPLRLRPIWRRWRRISCCRARTTIRPECPRRWRPARWFVQRNGARLLGQIASPEAVPLMLPLLRQSDPRIVREAVSALGAINDPAAARAIHTVLRSATGALRHAVIDALVASRDARV